MFISKKLLKIVSFTIGFIIVVSIRLFAAPTVGNVSGALTNGSSITITGTGFGANGPTIVVFDDFEGGTNGSNIKTGAGSATIGKWDRFSGDGSNFSKYDSTYKVSGNMSMKDDYTIQTNSGSDAGSGVVVDNINTGDVFVSYWLFLPTTSVFPCYNGGSCNWKTAWLTGIDSRYDDLQILEGLPGSQSPPYSDWNLACNGCYWGSYEIWYSFAMQKGRWYRAWTWIHATTDNTGHIDLWVMGKDDNIAVAQKVNWSGRFLNSAGGNYLGYFKHFILSPWARWCNNCAESAPRFDDVYLATGPNARARVEIGNSATYNSSTNLAIATVTSWTDTAISATVRSGSFANFNNAYLYVIDANGNVNANGYPLCPRCPMSPTLKK